MNAFCKKATLQLTIWHVLVFLIAGCSSSVDLSSKQQATSPMPTQQSGIISDTEQTLSSLEKLDDYPLYVMHYAGEYTYPQIRSSLDHANDFGCSLFAALGETDSPLFGRNFDWEFSPALFLYTNPVDGYASVSMVDLTFLGIPANESMNLTELPLQERNLLLSAPALPFDGMNEYGLTIGMAAIPDEYADDTSYDQGRPTIGSIGVIRQVLDHARNVDEAIEVFGQYNVDFSGGPPIHYLLADPSGKAVLIEFYQGKLVAMPNENAWHLATNHLRCIADGDGGCWRYRTLSEHLSANSGSLNESSAMQLLSEVKQESTQWSSIYNMTSGDIQVVIGRDYTKSYSFHLDLMKP